LIAQAGKFGIKADYLGIARDTQEDTLNKLHEALNHYDVTLLTGGVSMGDFDFVPAMMQRSGLEIMFQKIAIQPGKPTVLATKKDKICFGLPGNPVSSFILFEMIVKPVLYQMQGHTYQPSVIKLPLLKDFRRRRAERLNIVPVIIREGNSVDFVDYHGSAHIYAMSSATGVICVPEGITEINKGTLVDVRQI
jgi:molybdopterin molybdotransferase